VLFERKRDLVNGNHLDDNTKYLVVVVGARLATGSFVTSFYRG
jgi:hypothetical protein